MKSEVKYQFIKIVHFVGLCCIKIDVLNYIENLCERKIVQPGLITLSVYTYLSVKIGTDKGNPFI